MSHVRLRFKIETGAAIASSAVFVLTLVRRDWIEALFGFDPDHHSGSAEWLILGILLAVAVISSALATVEWRRLRAASAASS